MSECFRFRAASRLYVDVTPGIPGEQAGVFLRLKPRRGARHLSTGVSLPYSVLNSPLWTTSCASVSMIFR